MKHNRFFIGDFNSDFCQNNDTYSGNILTPFLKVVKNKPESLALWAMISFVQPCPNYTGVNYPRGLKRSAWDDRRNPITVSRTLRGLGVMTHICARTVGGNAHSYHPCMARVVNTALHGEQNLFNIKN